MNNQVVGKLSQYFCRIYEYHLCNLYHRWRSYDVIYIHQETKILFDTVTCNRLCFPEHAFAKSKVCLEHEMWNTVSICMYKYYRHLIWNQFILWYYMSNCCLTWNTYFSTFFKQCPWKTAGPVITDTNSTDTENGHAPIAWEHDLWFIFKA